MNFQDLLAKIRTIDEAGEQQLDSIDSHTVEADDKPVEECPPGMMSDRPLMDGDVEECGMPPSMGSMSSMAAPKQPDNVSMNISMNGSGAGGIRDLMAILRDIEHGGQDKDMIVGIDETNPDGDFSTTTTAPNTSVAPVDAVIPTGNDLHSKGIERPAVAGGGNPLNVKEDLVSKLETLYNEVKSR